MASEHSTSCLVDRDTLTLQDEINAAASVVVRLLMPGAIPAFRSLVLCGELPGGPYPRAIQLFHLGPINNNERIYKSIVSIVEDSRTVAKREVYSHIYRIAVNSCDRIDLGSKQMMVALAKPHVEAIDRSIRAIHTRRKHCRKRSALGPPCGWGKVEPQTLEIDYTVTLSFLHWYQSSAENSVTSKAEIHA